MANRSKRVAFALFVTLGCLPAIRDPRINAQADDTRNFLRVEKWVGVITMQMTWDDQAASSERQASVHWSSSYSVDVELSRDEKTSTQDRTFWKGSCKGTGSLQEWWERRQIGYSGSSVLRSSSSVGGTRDCGVHDGQLSMKPGQYQMFMPMLPLNGMSRNEATDLDGKHTVQDEPVEWLLGAYSSSGAVCCPEEPLPHSFPILSSEHTFEFAYDEWVGAQFVRWAGGGKKKATVHVSWMLAPANLSEAEAVILPPSKYDQWMPEADQDESTPGNDIQIRVVLQKKGQPGKKPDQKARFVFELAGVSKEKGVCLNAPPKDRAKDGFDLKILEERNPQLHVKEDGQSAESDSGQTGATVTVTSFDWGAYGHLKVTAKLDDGQQVVAHIQDNNKRTELTLPLDDNGNHVADAWEKQMLLYEKNLPADWDESWNPDHGMAGGDGISLYEKYRGFEFEQDHERLDLHWKHVFVYDPDELVRSIANTPASASLGTESLIGVRLRYVDDDHWTGRGSARDGKRVVNFNRGFESAVEQHALDVTADSQEVASTTPADWVATEKQAGLKVPATGIGELMRGYTFPDGRSLANGPPVMTYRIVVYPLLIRKDMLESAAATMHEDLPDYIRAHPDEPLVSLQKWMAYVISHEMMHGLGVSHHKPVPTMGNQRCIMRYYHYSLYRDDPFGVRSQWPDILCGRQPKSGNCWEQVVVSDRLLPE